MIKTSTYEETIRIAVIIATKNRPNKLSNLSLLSVRNQCRKPNIVVIVDDSDKKYKPLNEEIVSEFRCGFARIVYLENYRTSGACGAWNSAFSWLLREAPDSYVAILDDDDKWDNNYLEKCEEQILKNKLDMIVTGIIRFDDSHPEGFKLKIPEKLKAEQFLIGNPHIQGSNLFIRLKTILEAGAFDESLKSTTDRDICIRIADLGYIKVGFLKEYLVHHYAFSSDERLSKAGSANKLEGLKAFYRKYKPRMDYGQREAFMKRAKELFEFTEVEERFKEDVLDKIEKQDFSKSLQDKLSMVT